MSRGYFDYEDQYTLTNIEDALDRALTEYKDEGPVVSLVLERTKVLTKELRELLYEVDSYLSGDSSEITLLEYIKDIKLLKGKEGLDERLKALRIKQHDFLIPINYRDNKKRVEMYKKRGDKVEYLEKDNDSPMGWTFAKVTYKEAVENDKLKESKEVDKDNG